MKLEELTKYLVESLVENKEDVLVEREDGENEIIITVLVPKEEIGAVIGRNGKLANAIRTIVQAAAYTTKAGFVKINIDAK